MGKTKAKKFIWSPKASKPVGGEGESQEEEEKEEEGGGEEEIQDQGMFVLESSVF